MSSIFNMTILTSHTLSSSLCFFYFYGHTHGIWHMEVSQQGTEFEPVASTYATAAAMPNPLAHCAGLGMKPSPLQQPEPLQSDS